MKKDRNYWRPKLEVLAKYAMQMGYMESMGLRHHIDALVCEIEADTPAALNNARAERDEANARAHVAQAEAALLRAEVAAFRAALDDEAPR